MFGKRKNPVVIDIDFEKTPITEEAVRSYVDSEIRFRSLRPSRDATLIAVGGNIVAIFPTPLSALMKALRLAELEVGHSLRWQEELPMPGATEPRLLIGIMQLLDGSYRATWQLGGSWMGDRELLITDEEFQLFEVWRPTRNSGPFGFSGAGRGPNLWSARAER